MKPFKDNPLYMPDGTKIPTFRKTDLLPSSAAIELADEVRRGGDKIENRLLAKMVEDMDVMKQCIGGLYEGTCQFQTIVYSKLESIEDQLPSAFLRRVWFPITLAVLISITLAWMGLK